MIKSTLLLALVTILSCEKTDVEEVLQNKASIKLNPISFALEEFKAVKYLTHSPINISISINSTTDSLLTFTPKASGLSANSTYSFFNCSNTPSEEDDWQQTISEVSIEQGGSFAYVCLVVKSQQKEEDVEVFLEPKDGWEIENPGSIDIEAIDINAVDTNDKEEGLFSKQANGSGCARLIVRNTILGFPKTVKDFEGNDTTISLRLAVDRSFYVLDTEGNNVSVFKNDNCSEEINQPLNFPGGLTTSAAYAFVKLTELGKKEFKVFYDTKNSLIEDTLPITLTE